MRGAFAALLMLVTAVLLWAAWSYGWSALTSLPHRDEVRTASAEVRDMVARQPVEVGRPANAGPTRRSTANDSAAPATGDGEGNRIRFVEKDGIVGVRIEGPLERAPSRVETEPADVALQAAPVETPDVYRLVVIESAGVINARTHKIRLAHVDAPVETASCTRPNGDVWPCGMRARTAMRRLIRRRAIECHDLKPVDLEAPLRLASCEVAGTDLAQWLVEQGWAEPAGGAPDAWRALNESAKAAQKGIYSIDARRGGVPGIPR
ncbi:thermonuclease family protein [Acuticoccus sp. MNP-M23]|uniref:thermonuclease family protein n=1 Tax=Acuticoccus sp. MNP-M23 TaxID=3072793 RepID=UPI002814C8FE|nr:thermonuclease family protein [Acuticoccus sp. MNP-M23]WMS44370.1 thermonuclease family protein [Acuticoccus sp. MNP-M23]